MTKRINFQDFITKPVDGFVNFSANSTVLTVESSDLICPTCDEHIGYTKEYGRNVTCGNCGEEFLNEAMEQPEDTVPPQDGDIGDGVVGDENSQEDAADELDDLDNEEDPNSMVIRNVKNAHLVYKRATDEGSYEELWVYRLDNIKDDLTIRKAILAGTDIQPGKLQSDDGVQTYEMWTAGNGQTIHITGLPN